VRRLDEAVLRTPRVETDDHPGDLRSLAKWSAVPVFIPATCGHLRNGRRNLSDDGIDAMRAVLRTPRVETDDHSGDLWSLAKGSAESV